MNSVELRVPLHLVERLFDAVRPLGGNERVAFGLVAAAATPRRMLLLLRDVIPAPEEAYLEPGTHGARWSGRFTLAVLNRALAESCGVVIFHMHGFGNPVRLSPDDEESGAEQLELFARVQPDRPHGSVVIGEATAAGLFHINGKLVRPDRFRLRLLGSFLEDRENRSVDPAPVDDEAFARQILLVGSRGQHRLRGATAAVVGLGGGGSHVVQQLAHLGIGRILGIDHDVGDETNRSRMIGLMKSDVRESRLKADVLADLVARIDLGTEFVPIRAKLPSHEAVQAIRDADVMVGCVDNYRARADLQALAWRFLIPYIDIGLIIDPEQRHHPDRRDNWIAGNVYTVIPGSTCLWCTGFLTRAKLDAETGGRDPSYVRDSPGAAQVVSLNGVLGSQAATEVLQLLTAFGERPGDSRLLKMNGVHGTLEKWAIRPRSTCDRCKHDLAAGDPVWTSSVA